MKTLDAWSLIDSLKTHFPPMKILILTKETNPFFLSNILSYHVEGLLRKNQHSRLTIDAIKTLSNGDTYVQPTWGTPIIGAEIEKRILDKLNKNERACFMALGEASRSRKQTL